METNGFLETLTIEMRITSEENIYRTGQSRTGQKMTDYRHMEHSAFSS